MNKTLYKVKDQAQVSGVCQGIAEYADMDVSLVRILFVVVSLFTGLPVILYIVFAIVLPEKSDVIQEDIYTSEDDEEYGYDEDDYRI